MKTKQDPAILTPVRRVTRKHAERFAESFLERVPETDAAMDAITEVVPWPECPDDRVAYRAGHNITAEQARSMELEAEIEQEFVRLLKPATIEAFQKAAQTVIDRFYAERAVAVRR